MIDLKDIVAQPRPRTSKRPAIPPSLENAKAKYLGKTGALTELLKGLANLPAVRYAPRPARASTTSRRSSRRHSTKRRDALAEAKLNAAARRRRDRRDAARTRPRPRRPASDHARAGAGRDAVSLTGFHGRRRPGNRGRLSQLHGAQHAGEPPGPLDAGHVLRRGRHGAAHAYVADPGALHGNAQAADQDHRAGPRLSRRQRRHALADVPPGRRPVDRPRRHVRRPEGHAHRIPAQLLRARRHARPLPSVVLPVHRAVRGDRHGVRRRRLARNRRRRPGSSRTCCAPSASIPRSTRASPSAWAPIAWRCCATASTTCASSTKTTCASCASSTDRRRR